MQDREFDVLLKLKHPNIVKLLAIEEDVSYYIKGSVSVVATPVYYPRVHFKEDSEHFKQT